MSTELDVSWFDLKKYDALAEQDLTQWFKLLSMREVLGIMKTPDKEKIEDIKRNPLSDDAKFDGFLRLKQSRGSTRKSTIYPVSRFNIPLTLNDSQTEFIGIDLSASDEQVRNDFEKWLKDYRKNTEHKHEPVKKNFTDKDMSKWVEYRVLPYLDLMLVAKYEGKKIRQKKIVELIFPDYVELDKLRKTIKPEAERLMKYKTLSAIAAQICAVKG